VVELPKSSRAQPEVTSPEVRMLTEGNVTPKCSLGCSHAQQPPTSGSACISGSPIDHAHISYYYYSTKCTGCAGARDVFHLEKRAGNSNFRLRMRASEGTLRVLRTHKFDWVHSLFFQEEFEVVYGHGQSSICGRTMWWSYRSHRVRNRK
jgi:hypothetical protein